MVAQIKGYQTTLQNLKSKLSGGCASYHLSPAQPNGHSTCTNFAFQLLKIKTGFHCYGSPFLKSAGPDEVSLTLAEAALLKLAVSILLVAKQSGFKAHVDMPVGQSHLTVTDFCFALLQTRISKPCAQTGWESHD